MVLKAFSKFIDSFKGIPREVWLLSCVSLINRSGAMVIMFLTLYLTKALHFDIKSAGYIMSSFGVGSIIGAYLGGVMTDRLGYYIVQWFTLVAHGVMLWVIMFIDDFYLLIIGLGLIGVFSEAFRPANSVAVKIHSDAATRTRSLSLMRVAVNLAISVALVVGGLLVSLGWNWLFIIDGLTCFGAAGMVLFSLKERKAQPITVETDVKTPTNHPPQYQGDISAYKNKKYLFFIISTFLGATVFMQIMWTVPAFFSEVYGWNEAMIGMMSAINGICVVALEMPLIYRIEKKRSALWFVRLGIICYMVAYLSFILPQEWAWFLAAFYMVIISFGEIFVMPFSTTWAMQQGNHNRQGQYMALYTMAYSISNVIAPMVGTQVIAAYGFKTLWVVLAGLGVLALGGFWYLEQISPQKKVAHSAF